MNSYDVIVIGRGFTALSTAWHLRRLGITRVALIGPNRLVDNCNSLMTHQASATLYDNATRLVHNLGEFTARDLLSLARCGLSELMRYLQLWDLPHAAGQVKRISSSEHETREMNQACLWLSQNGFPAVHQTFMHKNLRCHSIQNDGAASVFFDAQQLLQQLEVSAQAEIVSDVVERTESGDRKVIVRTKNKEIYTAELVVIACHLGIKSLIPELGSALVSHADQVIEFGISSGQLPTNPGDQIFINHGQYWMTHKDVSTIKAGGARFLRKWGGIEAESASTSNEITESVRKKIEDIFQIELSVKTPARGFIELYACDELPIIGPMFGDSRLLVASGFMNSGASLALASGRGLAEFIAHGRSRTISEKFLPSRLRSLPESS